jgi:hypothetical protein
MKNIIYSKTLCNFAFSEDHESPYELELTKEVNGYALFIYYDFYKWFNDKNLAIEEAVIKSSQLERQAKELCEGKDSNLYCLKISEGYFYLEERCL